MIPGIASRLLMKNPILCLAVSSVWLPPNWQHDGLRAWFGYRSVRICPRIWRNGWRNNSPPIRPMWLNGTTWWAWLISSSCNQRAIRNYAIHHTNRWHIHDWRKWIAGIRTQFLQRFDAVISCCIILIIILIPRFCDFFNPQRMIPGYWRLN